MISPSGFFAELQSHSIDFYTGVPDSLLKDFCAYVTDHTDSAGHIICANEGAAIGTAAGHYLATRHPALVYMQNSGLGNAINPLLSLADPEVYSIPMLLLIGWRGEPDRKDEPQHKKQGRVILPMLDAMSIPYQIIDESTSDIGTIVGGISSTMLNNSCPVALVVRAGAFAPYTLQRTIATSFELDRESALKIILESLRASDVVIATTGMLSREIFEYRESMEQGHGRDFLTVGSMGHSSQIALGIAMAKPDRQVYSLDGDGAVLMHMGSLAIIGTQSPPNFKHIIMNNGAHDSVGGQPTAGFSIDFCGVAKACGYSTALCAVTTTELRDCLKTLERVTGPAMLEIKVNKGSRKNLGRPTTTPAQNRDQFMTALQG